MTISYHQAYRPRLNTRLAIAAFAAAVLLVTLNVYVWLDPDLAPFAAHGQSAIGNAPLTLTLRARLASMLVSTVHLALLAWALLVARSLFARFAKGLVFEIDTGFLIRRLGLLLIAFAIGKPLVRTLIGVFITMDNEPGQQHLAIGFAGDEFIIGLVGALLIMVGAAMAEAARIAKENQQII